jgi:hypothetical protein
MARAAVLALRADIDRLAATAPPDGLAPAAIAERLSVSPRAMTFRRALWSAVADGGWIAEGSSKARRYRPATTTVAGEDLSLPAGGRRGHVRVVRARPRVLIAGSARWAANART